MSDSDSAELFDASLFLNENYKIQEFVFGDIKFRAKLSEAGSTDYDLTGQVIWPAAPLLCQYLVKNSSSFQGKRILEVGSGVGVTGLLAAHICCQVVVTDHIKTVMKILDENVATLNNPSCFSRVLDWADLSHRQAILNEFSPFDAVIGSDVVFWKDSIVPLFQTVRDLLQPGAEFFLSYQSRTLITDRFLLEVAAEHDFQTRNVEPSEIMGAESGNPDLRFLIFRKVGQGSIHHD